MAQGNVLGQSIGQKINGITEEYKITPRSKNGIKAGDFVTFVNNYSVNTTVTAGDINDIETTFSWSSMQCFKLSETSIIIVYQTGKNIYGVIGTITNEDITLGTSNLLISSSSSITFQGINILANNKISLVYKGGTAGLNVAFFIVNDNSSINLIDSNVYIFPFSFSSSLNYTLGDIMTRELDENRIFITYTLYQPTGYNDDDNKCNLYGLICKLNGESLSFSNTIILDYSKFHIEKPYNSLLKISNNKIFILYRYTLPYFQIGLNKLSVQQKGILCNIDENNNISVEQNILLFETDTTSTINHTFILVNSTTILYLYKIDDTAIYGIVLQINTNGSVRIGEKTILNGPSSLNNSIVRPIMNLSNNNVYYIFNSEILATDETNRKSKLIGNILKIDDLDIKFLKTETIKELENTSKSDSFFEYITPIDLENNNFDLIVENIDKTLNRRVLKYFSLDIIINYINQLINKINSKESKILGIAKTAGTASQTIKVYVPKIEEVN